VTSSADIDPQVPPSGPGCVECLASEWGWWFHLRRCALCGHVGCCDSSPSQHASRHASEAGHPVAQSYEPGEDWFWDYEGDRLLEGPVLAPPHHRPLDQPSPGPEGRVPADWTQLLH
jgi:Zn-finger in ubiquitin-hydrolases and other protein